jgi:putative YhdH/YhfP family quinone oxidoreductase
MYETVYTAGRFTRSLRTAEISALPEKELIINVKYTPINTEDALISHGRFPQLGVQNYPICPGIDAIGEVVSSKIPNFVPGDEVAVCGGGIGTTAPGGFGEYISAPADAVVTLPIGLSMKTAAVFGSAGVTVALSLIVLQNMGITGRKRIAVTGASTDIGALAASVFSHLGYSVTAVVKDGDSKDFVSQFNIDAAITESEISPSFPLFDGIFDSVGGDVLAALIGRLNNDGIALAAGCYENPVFTASLLPFTERGIGIIGVNGMNSDIKTKSEMWQIISSELVNPYIDWICTEISIEELEKYLPLVLSGDLKGRAVIDYNA